MTKINGILIKWCQQCHIYEGKGFVARQSAVCKSQISIKVVLLALSI